MGRLGEGGWEAMVWLMLGLFQAAPSPTAGLAAWCAVPILPSTVPAALGLLHPAKNTQHAMAPGQPSCRQPCALILSPIPALGWLRWGGRRPLTPLR